MKSKLIVFLIPFSRPSFLYIACIFLISSHSLFISRTASAQTSPIAQWNFEEGSQCTTADEITPGVDGSLGPDCLGNGDAPVWSLDAKVGTHSLEFNGAGDEINLGDIEMNHPLQLANSEMTITAWIKQGDNGDGWQRIVDKSTGGGGANGYAFYANPGTRQVGCSVNGNSYKSDNDVFNLNDWTHVAAVITNSAFTIYVNGIAKEGNFNSGHSAQLPPNVTAPIPTFLFASVQSHSVVIGHCGPS